MARDLKAQREEWFQHAEGDWIGAKHLYNMGDAPGTIGLLIQQGLEKYLKGYLLGEGWELIKTHNIELLLAEAARYDSRFEAFFTFGKAVTALYSEERYPYSGSEDVPMERLRAMIETGEKVIGLVRGGSAFAEVNP